MIRNRCGRGFTLIELLVVVSIIALLVSILMPALGRARTQAKSALCMTNMRTWGLYFRMFADDNDGKMMTNSLDQSNPGEYDHWCRSLFEYFEGFGEITTCPTTKYYQWEMARTAPAGLQDWTFVGWGKFSGAYGNTWLMDGAYGSYGQNLYCSAPRTEAEARTILGGKQVELDMFVPSFSVRQASEIPIFADSMWWCFGPTQPPYTTSGESPSDAGPEYRGQWAQWTESHLKWIAIDRHLGVNNLAYLDGHAEKVPLRELWRQQWHRKWDRYLRADDWFDQYPGLDIRN